MRPMALLLLVGSMAACGMPKTTLMVRVAGLADGSPLPSAFTADGGDLSPSISWTGAPPEAHAIVILVEDPDAPGGSFTHWMVYDLPVSPGLAEGRPQGPGLPGGGRQGQNDFGRLGWNGPAPPPGKVHHYVFQVFALSSTTGLPSGVTVDVLRGAMKGKIVAQGRWTGTYKR